MKEHFIHGKKCKTTKKAQNHTLTQRHTYTKKNTHTHPLSLSCFLWLCGSSVRTNTRTHTRWATGRETPGVCVLGSPKVPESAADICQLLNVCSVTQNVALSRPEVPCDRQRSPGQTERRSQRVRDVTPTLSVHTFTVSFTLVSLRASHICFSWQACSITSIQSEFTEFVVHYSIRYKWGVISINGGRELL